MATPVIVLGLALLLKVVLAYEEVNNCETNAFCQGVEYHEDKMVNYDVCCDTSNEKVCSENCDRCMQELSGNCVEDPPQREEPPDPDIEGVRNCKSAKFCKTQTKFAGEKVKFQGCCKGAHMEGRPMPNLCIPDCSICTNAGGRCVEPHQDDEVEETIFNCKSTMFCTKQKEFNGKPFTFKTCCKGGKNHDEEGLPPICAPTCEDCKNIIKGTCMIDGAVELRNDIVVVVVVVVVATLRVEALLI